MHPGDTHTHARTHTHTHTHTHTQGVNPEGDVVMAHVADCQQRRLVEVSCSIERVCVCTVCERLAERRLVEVIFRIVVLTDTRYTHTHTHTRAHTHTHIQTHSHTFTRTQLGVRLRP